MLEAAGVDGGASGEVAMAKKTQEMVFAWEKNWAIIRPSNYLGGGFFPPICKICSKKIGSIPQGSS